MKRGGPLRRFTPLRRGTVPLRRTPLARVSVKNKAKEAEYARARARVHRRDRGLCVVCKRVATDTHHIIHRSLGGNHDDANLVSLCRACHDTAHLDKPRSWVVWFTRYMSALPVDEDDDPTLD